MKTAKDKRRRWIACIIILVGYLIPMSLDIMDIKLPNIVLFLWLLFIPCFYLFLAYLPALLKGKEKIAFKKLSKELGIKYYYTLSSKQIRNLKKTRLLAHKKYIIKHILKKEIDGATVMFSTAEEG